MIKLRILILGGASGVAYATAVEFVKSGDMVYLGVHTEEQVEMVKEKNKIADINMYVFKIDILNDSDLDILDKIEYDILWAHAGIGIGGSLLYMDVDNLRNNYNVNVFGTMRVVQRGYKNMLKRNVAGRLFVTSSMARCLPFPFLGCYTSSKASLSMLVRSIHEELKFLKSPISISLIELGAYHTGFNQVMIDNKEKYLECDNKIYYQLESINRLQRNVFRLIESDDIGRLSKNLVVQMKRRRVKFLIRYPISQSIFTKFYDIFKI